MPSPRARRRPFRLPALLVALVALSVLNPFCCKFLPFFAADVLQTEENVEGEDELCPGKPKAVRDELAVLPDIGTDAPSGESPWGGSGAVVVLLRG